MYPRCVGGVPVMILCNPMAAPAVHWVHQVAELIAATMNTKQRVLWQIRSPWWKA